MWVHFEVEVININHYVDSELCCHVEVKVCPFIAGPLSFWLNFVRRNTFLHEILTFSWQVMGSGFLMWYSLVTGYLYAEVRGSVFLWNFGNHIHCTRLHYPEYHNLNLLSCYSAWHLNVLHHIPLWEVTDLQKSVWAPFPNIKQNISYI